MPCSGGTDCGRKAVLRYVSLLVGCLCMLTAGSIAAINAYSSDLRDSFNMTQSQVSVVIAVGNLGFSSGMVPGLLIERVGSVWTSVVGLVLGTGSNLAITGSILERDWFMNNLWAVYIGACLLGFGSNFLFTNGLVTNTMNYTIFGRGKVVGLLSAFFWAGSSVFSAIYEGIFDRKPDAVGALDKYFIFTACVFGIVSFLALLFMRHYPLTHEVEEYLKEYQNEQGDAFLDQNGQAPPLEKSVTSTRKSSKSQVPRLSYGDLRVMEMVTNLDFHLLFWPCVLCNGIQTAVIFNLSTFFESFSLMDYIGIVTIGGPLIGSASKFLSGYLSDLTLMRLPRLWIVTASNLLQAAVLAVCVYSADAVPVTVMLAVIHYLAIGVEMSVVPAILGDLFGVKHFGRNWGVMMFFNAVSASVLQISMGVLYDAEKVPGDTACYGNHCFQTSFLVFLLLTLISLVLDLVLLVKQVKLYRRHWAGLKQQNTEDSYLIT